MSLEDFFCSLSICVSLSYFLFLLILDNSSAVNLLPNRSSLETNADSMYQSPNDLGRSGR
jgi:hypothetical protein